MRTIKEIFLSYSNGQINKEIFIKLMHENRHSILFEYADFLSETNIKKIEIEDAHVVMTSRNRGVRIQCAPDDYRIAPIETLNFSDYEKSESRMMENLIGDGDYFFDIGANIGWYSLNIGMSNRSVRVFSFEPIPKTYQELLGNLKINPSKNITAYNFGFSRLSGEFDFYYYPEGSGNASSANVTGRLDIEKVKCSVKTLDEFIENSGLHVDFIKCDVEGAELLVFQGGIEVIKRDKPIIFSEILRKWSRKFEYDPNEIFHLLRGIGYEAFTVDQNYLNKFFLMSEETVETNFFFLHKEKHKDLICRWKRDK